MAPSTEAFTSYDDVLSFIIGRRSTEGDLVRRCGCHTCSPLVRPARNPPILEVDHFIYWGRESETKLAAQINQLL